MQVTTPGGQTINKVGRGGAATGPGGRTAGSKGSIANTTGPAGSGSAASRSGFASGPGGSAGYRSGAVSGPGGAAAGRTGAISGPGGTAVGRTGAVSGPGGTAVGRAGAVAGPGGVAAGRAGAAVGPGGAAVGRTGAISTANGTYYRSAGAISGQGAYVRAGWGGYGYGNYFTGAWAGRYPGYWFPGKWAGAAAWTAAAWGSVAGYGGYPEDSTAYDYGSSAVYEGDTVYVNGDNVGTAEEYSEQATVIADTGKQAEAPVDGDWMPLGVFAMVQGEETKSNDIFQLAMNKDGVIRGNYYNALTDSTEPVYGSVDKKTQRAAWTVGDRKTPVYEAGIVNLTKDDTTMMVHYGKGNSQQFSLFRLEKPEEAPKEGQ